ncbi:MAG: hypothetical protein K0R68_2789, partial [Mycobacterium sp.]|nr:hypothetical protein [Mycobacterium sp.]
MAAIKASPATEDAVTTVVEDAAPGAPLAPAKKAPAKRVAKAAKAPAKRAAKKADGAPGRGRPKKAVAGGAETADGEDTGALDDDLEADPGEELE